MKKLALIALLLLGAKGFAQVSKADIELQLSSFPQSKYEFVFLSNVRTYYNDGTVKLEQKQYYANKCTIEPKEHALHLKFYGEEAKTTLTDISVIPYSMIIRTEAYGSGFVIDLMQ